MANTKGFHEYRLRVKKVGSKTKEKCIHLVSQSNFILNNKKRASIRDILTNCNRKVLY